jgi:methylglutaconyl-CoA hydratase
MKVDEMIELTWNEKKSIVTLTLNDIKKSNALNVNIIQALSNCLDELEASSTLKVCVIQSGAKHFCVGADIDWLQSSVHMTDEENFNDASLLADLLKKLYQLPCITIAIVHGATYGGGLGLLACCDFILALKSATFCFSEIKLGLVPATIAPYVAHKMPLQIMRRLMLTAEIFHADQALLWGWVDEVFESKDADACCERWCHRFLDCSKQSLLEGKRMFEELATINETLRINSIKRLSRIRQSADGQEGLKAFLEKRSPKWCDNV